MSKHVILCGGHHFDAAGATDGEGNSEFPETRIWADTILRNLHELNVSVCVIGSAPIRNKLPTVNAKVQHSELDCIFVEVHFNSSSSTKKPSGFETLYCPNSVKGKELASVVQEAMSTVMTGTDRGVKEGYYQLDPNKGIDAMLEKTACPAIIIEPEFVQHFDKITELREPCCKAIAEALAAYCA